jgi:hypothetical protein
LLSVIDTVLRYSSRAYVPGRPIPSACTIQTVPCDI